MVPPQTTIYDAVEIRLPHKRQDSEITAESLTITIAPDETCGFLVESTDVPVTCASGVTCSWESGQLNAAFCGLAYVATTCLDFNDAINTNICDGECQSNPYNWRCTNTAWPSCLTFNYDDGIMGYGCDSYSSSYSANFNRGQRDLEFRTTVLAYGGPSSTSSSSTSSLISSTTEPPSSTEPVDPTTTTIYSTTSTTQASGSGTNVGAIVGGVVGGVAAIGLLVLGIFGILVLRRRKRANATGSDPNPQVSVQQVQPQNGFQPDPNAGKNNTSPSNPTLRGSTVSPMTDDGQQYFTPYTMNAQHSPPVYQTPPYGHQSPVQPSPAYELGGGADDNHRGHIVEMEAQPRYN